MPKKSVKYAFFYKGKIQETLAMLEYQLRQQNWFIRNKGFSDLEAYRKSHPQSATRFHLHVDLSQSNTIIIDCHVDHGYLHHVQTLDESLRNAIWKELEKIALLKK